MKDEAGERRRWTEDETILALYLYFQLPFGKLHSGNPEIQNLSAALGRSSNSVAMKLCNFASLDPKIIASGRKGLQGASQLDRSVYAEFGQDWSRLVSSAEDLWASRVQGVLDEAALPQIGDDSADFHFAEYDGPSTTQRLVNQRVGQNFFRRAVLANYNETCCITGIADPRLLTASHIKPWSQDAANRHNPANGLLLSATLDRAFDSGLITIDKDRCVLLSRQLRESESQETRDYFLQFSGAVLRPAKRFDPDPNFLDWHNNHCFFDKRAA